MKTIRLTLTIFLLAGVAAAHGTYEAIDTTELVAHPETYEGRLVEVRQCHRDWGRLLTIAYFERYRAHLRRPKSVDVVGKPIQGAEQFHLGYEQPLWRLETDL